MVDVDSVSLAITVCAAFLLCALAVGGGVGGGALYMPVYVGLLDDAHIAVPLAKITTNGVAWSAFFFNLFARHPDDSSRPLINYDVALIMEPLTLIGTILGVALNVVLTSGHVLFTLVTVLGFTAYRTIEKGFKQREKELKFIADQAANGEQPAPAQELTPVASFGGERAALLDDAVESTAAAEKPIAFPWPKILTMVGLWLFHCACLTYAGGPFAIGCGNLEQRGAIVMNVLVQTLFTLCWRSHCLRKQAAKHASEFGDTTSTLLAASSQGGREGSSTTPAGTSSISTTTSGGRRLLQENFHFGTMNTLAYPLLSGVAGVCAGSLGIAGGLIKGPLMVDWGLAAQSATATAIFMIMFTSSSTILQFIILGRLELKISLLLWFTGFGGGLLGSKIVADVLRKIDRQSFVTFFLGFIIVASAVCMSSVVLLQMLGIFPQPRSDAGDLDYCDLAALH
mmetsp:Transcript_11179/g.27341  ORF Transcript_11179/g.27341 Transcript_11179/m.27341 type:complete len:455 (+) Transcript_11179:261-1625(+)|eukprot:CAMPEP_0178987702 /NCGR_PEP_ID=MMETSP0795-20121207/3409_1 /TAXON_ID=88552 /ORGANISM="Amoebophrya sp., Strain Ameob2" /LENGTH=454 /DNA_ID=CAMNT_0020678909 /DNA_START=214 /DNA_END=1578 /DNA_ORIENTATION=-